VVLCERQFLKVVATVDGNQSETVSVQDVKTVCPGLFYATAEKIGGLGCLTPGEQNENILTRGGIFALLLEIWVGDFCSCKLSILNRPPVSGFRLFQTLCRTGQVCFALKRRYP
jgi:hypothetical protein